jgi:Leucine-rich repeat (LRR) protein
MIKFTLVGGKVVLDPNIVLFEPLHKLYKSKNGPKYLQVIYYMNSTDPDNPFRDFDPFVLEENVLMTIFKKNSFESLKMSGELKLLFQEAEDIFIKHNSTPEKRLLKAVDKKLDEISTMLNENIPKIEESVSEIHGTKFSTNLNIMLNAFTKIEVIMKSKTLLQNAVLKADGAGKVRGGGSTSFRERGLK